MAQQHDSPEPGHEAHGHDAHDHADDAGHGHDHGDHAHPTGPLAKLKELFAPHSHDAGDSIDAELETSSRGIRALIISFVALMVTTLLQAVVVVVSGSVALLGDTLHNAADALTAVPLAIAFTIGRRAATRRFTYGYGRAEGPEGLALLDAAHWATEWPWLPVAAAALAESTGLDVHVSSLVTDPFCLSSRSPRA